MAERINCATLNLAFQRRINIELQILYQKLQVQLREDINRIYSESLYSDFEICFKSGSIIKTHSSLLRSRTPQFFNKLLVRKYNSLVFESVDRQAIASFIGEIYITNELGNKEENIVQYLEERNNIPTESPDSDVYLTPKASPSDFYHSQLQSVALQTDHESPISAIHKTNALYYSLVTVEEEFKDATPIKNGNAVLERELAEQDELLNSFRSIIFKERKNKKHIKPSSLTFLSSSQHKSNCVVQETSRKKKKRLEYKLDTFSCTPEKYTSHTQPFQNSTNESVKSNFKRVDTQHSTYFWCPTANCTKEFNAKENQESVWKINHRNMSVELNSERDDMLQSNRDQDRQALDSNVEGESSGYLTSSSPKDHTTSKICTDDTKTHEGCQYKNGNADESFQASLDTGTWDSMLSDETSLVSNNASATNLPDLVRVKAPSKDILNSKAMSLIKKGVHKKNLSEKKSDLMLHLNDSANGKISSLSQECAIDKNSIKIDGDILTMAISDHVTVIQPNIAVEHRMNKESPIRNGNTLAEMNDSNLNNGETSSLKNNFFIDASSLFDENELTQSSLTKNYKKLCSEAICETNLDSKIKLGCGSCTYETTVSSNHNKINCISSMHNEAVDCTNHSETCLGDMSSSFIKEKSKVNTKQDTGIVESPPHRASLIRRKTFELDPDDEKLALLRQEYERRQGNSIFQTHPQSQSDSTSPPLSDFEIDGVKSIKPPNSLLFEPKKNVFDEEIHSPDSLNNDGPLESIGEVQRLSNEFEGITFTSDVQSLLIADNDMPNTNDRNVTNDTENEENERKLLEGRRNIIDVSAVNSNEVLVLEDDNNLKGLSVSGSGLFEAVTFPIAVAPVPYSPLMSRRKTEFAPILSGGVKPDPEPDPKPSSKPRNNSLSTSWVVDMSNGVKPTSEVKRKCRNDSTTSNQSTDYTSLSSEDSSVVSKSFTKGCKSNGSSFGFFVDMDGHHNQNLKLSGTENEVGKPSFSCVEGETKNLDRINSACRFYIDLSSKEDLKTETQSQSLESGIIFPEKKLFSMFIDISDSSKDLGVSLKSKKVRLKTHAERFTSKHSDEANLLSESHSSDSSLEVMDNGEVSNNKNIFTGGQTPPPSRQISTTEHSTSDLTTNKKSFFMFIDADSSPVPKRRTLPTGLRPSFQRHSWNPESQETESQSTSVSKSNHQRAHSVSMDESPLTDSRFVGTKPCNLLSFAKNISSENSSGFYDSGPSSIDDNVIQGVSNNKVMQASWHGSVKPSTELSKMKSQSEYNGVKTSQIALFECSKEAKASAKTIEGCENTNQISVEETSRCLDENLDTLSLSNGSSQGQHNRTFTIDQVSKLANSTSNDLDLSTQSQDFVSELSKDESSKTEVDSAQPLLKSESSSSKNQSYSNETPTNQDSLPKLLSTVPEENSFVKLSDMDKEPVKLAIEEKRIINRMSRSIPEATWLESKMMTRSATSRSLSRLFPHLAHTPEPDETDYSELSSMQSSIDPSALEGSTEETDESLLQQNGPCSRLGEDLLRMFLDEISADVTVQVGGRRIKAHKCILSSRCQYFAAMLSGGWVESAGNVISLQGFSYNAVHFALCHIYSGASNVPDSINIVELATLADMLCLEGLKEVIMFTLKVKFCHFFHKPCSMCIVGVLECLPLAAAYGLDEIYRKGLRWITKYFVRVWPTKGFATLPRELIDKCYKQHIINMNVENVLETIISCDKLESTTTNVRWAEPVFILISKLRDAALKFIAQHFSSVLSSEMFLSLGKDMSWNISQLEETLLVSTERLPPDQACKSYSRLYNILQLADLPDPLPEMAWTTSFVDLLHCIYDAVENSLVRQANRAVRCPSWSMMEPQLRHKIQDTACLVIVPGDDRRKTRHSTLLKRGEYSGRSSDAQTPKIATNNVASGKRVISSVRPLSANQNTTHNKKQSSTTAITVTLSPRPKSAGYKVPEVKSRYLEQRPPRTANLPEKPTLSVTTQRRNSGKPTISSSDSSRNSSPAMRRSLGSRTSRASAQQLSISTDSLADSKGKGPNMGERTQRSKTESNVKTNSSQVKNVNVKATALKTEGNRSKSSTVATVSKKFISQNSSRVVDSPLLLKKAKSLNSTPSPLLKRTILPSVQNNKIPSEAKQLVSKRTSTFRIQNRGSLSPTKFFPKGKEVTSASCNVNSKVGITKPNGVAKVGDKRLLLNAGSRSSTFLKDGPTFPKKIQ